MCSIPPLYQSTGVQYFKLFFEAFEFFDPIVSDETARLCSAMRLNPKTGRYRIDDTRDAWRASIRTGCSASQPAASGPATNESPDSPRKKAASRIKGNRKPATNKN